MTGSIADYLHNALGGMTAGPKPLIPAICFYAQQAGFGSKNLGQELQRRIVSSPNDEVRKLLHQHLGRWDWETDARWTASTEPNTHSRRERIYDLLQIETSVRSTLAEHLPPYVGAKAVVIDDAAAIRGWYTPEFRRQHNFYWSTLQDFLTRRPGITPDAVNAIGASADRILSRLADPASPDIYKARGLVVGYVQSGKTTHFTSVIAKAIDAGYRLIIVLSGTTNLLRNQTQRRLDMDLVGVENILRGATDPENQHDYVEDSDWPNRFISYLKQPSLLGHVDIHRLTTHEDFESKDGGLNPLEFDFEKRERLKPLYARENLDHAGARIAVVKKQRDRLLKLVRELKAVGTTKCADVPTLIIDDESDQASVNTVKPNKAAIGKRSQINERIVEILERLPRAQYLGYTATPFANVFVNPNDPADIYPKDFIVSLERPDGYIGAKEFVDFEAPKPGRMSNSSAYIRDIPRSDNARDDRLQEAMDAFVLTGALKKFRQKHSGIEYKHHTMLFHHSVKKNDQEVVSRKLRSLWNSAGYGSPGAAAVRLEKLLEMDFRKVWSDRGMPFGLLFPRHYRDLRPFLGEALEEFRRGNSSPVLMVNSAEGSEVPDFDGKSGVWKIVVGGAKLSRGYTIEGLTISYFRRRTGMQDTLMQMGRWFGYRRGYADLARLYIGRAEPFGKKTLDLYRAFEAMCRDEEDFRAQLAMYEGEGGITPKEVPALVFNSYPALRPTSRNKMFNAKITWAAFDYREPTSQSATTTGRKDNAERFEKLLSKHRLKTVDVSATGTRAAKFQVKWAQVAHKEMVSLLESVAWDKEGNPIQAQIEFLSRKIAPIESWLLVAPQVEESHAGSWTVGKESLSCIARTRTGSRFGVFSSPEHLNFAKWLVGGSQEQFVSALKPRDKTGVLLFYPTRERVSEKKVIGGIPVMGFGIALPRSDGLQKRIAYSV